MSNNNIKSILIAGGGTSGWMSAIYLQKILNSKKQQVKVTLIESADLSTIGVGEATVHNIRHFFQALGLDEKELMEQTQATFKTGILFKNWRKPQNGLEHAYFHPFEPHNYGGIWDISTHWFLNESFKKQKFDEGVSISTYLARTGKSPKSPQSNQYQGLVPYAYHLDATLLGGYLRKKAIELGVEHVITNINSVDTHNGEITKIRSQEQVFSADLYIDCTGFKGLLIESLSDSNWVSYEDALPCNRAVAIQRNYPQGHTPNSYTTSTALSNGWVWQIDLQNRQGTGYVYDGNRLTKEEAEQELRAFLGEESDVLKSQHLEMKIGRRKEFWIGNCVAIGLSGGFIEPLESTGIYLIETGIKLLSGYQPSLDSNQILKDAYNQTMSNLYEDLKDFIVLHYCLTDRDDTEFWCHSAKTHEYTPKLKEKLDLWQYKVCQSIDFQGSQGILFSEHNYRYVLYGMDYYPNIIGTLQETITDIESQHVFQQFKHNAHMALEQAIPHKAYFK